MKTLFGSALACWLFIAVSVVMAIFGSSFLGENQDRAAALCFLAAFCFFCISFAVLRRHGRLNAEACQAEIYDVLYAWFLRYAGDALADEDLLDSVGNAKEAVRAFESGEGITADALEFGSELLDRLPGFTDHLRGQPFGGDVINRLDEGWQRYQAAVNIIRGDVEAASQNGSGELSEDEVVHAADGIRAKA